MKSKPCMPTFLGKRLINPHLTLLGPLCTIPLKVNFVVYLLQKFSFCPIKSIPVSPNEFPVRTPLDIPHLKPHFGRRGLAGLGRVGREEGGGGCSKTVKKIVQELQIFCAFSILSQRSIFGSKSMALGEAQLDKRSCNDSIFRNLSDPVVPPLEGCDWGCCDSIPLPRCNQLSFADTFCIP